ncbi:MAG: hypothetical protein IKU07_08300 [Oscillospiraceae bacterium]|nr:hypothetical protein [Oscillospiraceae bacterium]
MKNPLSASKKKRPQVIQEIALWVALIMSVVHLINAITEILKYRNKKNTEN